MSAQTQIAPGVYRLYEPVSPRCYRIIRFYHPSLNRKSRTIKTGLSESEAQAHCKRPDTRKEGVYFDGYDLMKGVKPWSTQTFRLTVAEATFLADKAEALFQKAARAWERGDNSGDSAMLERWERQCDDYRRQAETILEPMGIETDYPGLYPSFRVSGRTYYTVLSAISAALEEQA